MGKERKGEFTCDHCNRNFTRKFALSRHMITIHINPSKSTQKNNLKCPKCSFSSFNSMRVNDHLIKFHEIELEETLLYFSSEDEFQQWKEKIETETRSSFSKRTSTRVPRAVGGPTAIYFTCNRSGDNRKKRTLERKRSKRVKGSCKTGAYCPARIKRYELDGKIKVLYCGIHIGHSHEIHHMRLPKSVEMLIVKKLQEGVSLDQLLSELRDEAVCSDILEKKHLLNRKALYNIIYKYKLSSVVKKSAEEVPKMHIEQVKSENDTNTILMYKKSDEPYDNLFTEDMILIIMTEEQREMLRNFGHDKICIDSTNNSEKLTLQLTSIFILDEFNVTFPACYCICNKVDENTLTMLFQEIKKIVGVINAKMFMSDDSSYFYNSWKKVMTEVKNQIICKWYIDRAWRKALDTLGSKEAKHEIYTFLRALLDETNKEKFDSLLRSLLVKLDEEGFYDFKQFFITNYAVRSQLWAECYREEAFLNTSMALESSHKALKILYAKFCQDNRVDGIIQLLMKTIRDKTFNRKINLNEGPVNTHVNDILIRHERARHIKKIYEIHNREWLVESESKNVKHSVHRKLNDCSCQLKCLVCKVCVHMYTCSCDDYFMSRNLCKHIHAICRSLEPIELSSSLNPPEDVYEIEITTDDITSQIKEEEEDVCSAENLFTSHMVQIRDMWDDGNGTQIKNPDNMRRLLELSSEMLNILAVEKNIQTNKISVTEVESLDQMFIPPLELIENSRLSTKSATARSDELETIIQRNIHNIVIH